MGGRDDGGTVNQEITRRRHGTPEDCAKVIELLCASVLGYHRY